MNAAHRLTEYPTRYICYMDLLGWKTLTERAAKDSLIFMAIHEAVTRLFIAKPAEWGIAHTGAHVTFTVMDFEPRIYTFSDHIVLSSPISVEGLSFLIHRTLSIIGDLLYHNDVCLRGAIVKGSLLDDKQCLFGPALNEAYYLENQLAIYPRILASESIINDLQTYKLQFESEGKEWLGPPDFRLDFDGLYHLETLRFPPLCTVKDANGPGTWGSPSHADWLTRVSQFIIKQTQIKHEMRTKAKYEWLKNYFNTINSEFPQYKISTIP